MSGLDYLRVVRSLPGLVLILEPDESYTVVDASDAYLRATHTVREEIVGRPLFHVFPDGLDDPAAEGLAGLRASLETVLRTRAPHTMALRKHDLRRSDRDDRRHEERWWCPVNAPVFSDDGAVELIVHKLDDATELVRHRRAEDERQREAMESDRLRRTYEAALANTPDLVYIFDLDHRFVYANEALLAMWGRTRDEALGKNCLELGYAEWHAAMHDREIEQVIATRKPIQGEVPFDGAAGRRIWDYIFVPVLGPGGDVVAIAGTSRDTTERRRAEEAIAAQARRLKEADRAKDEFIATLSHELRNPLAPLRNSLALLRMRQPSGDERRAHIVGMMERQLNHLVRLVDDLLEISRITRGDPVLRRERTQLGAVVRNAIETSTPLIQARKHTLDVSIPREPIWVDSDPVRLGQVVANLLDNAAKYTPAGGRIEVSVSREGNAAAVRVRDNGAGISPAAQEHIFRMFHRGDRATRRGEDGLGIGLSLARRLAELHGGSLQAASEGEGKGSEFVVRLPALEDTAVQADGGRDDRRDIAALRILVVDDNRDAADTLGTVLRQLGADVQVAHSGEEALDVFPCFEPSAVLLDIGMPTMDGYEVARSLRTLYPERRTPLIALTGWGQEQDRAKAREAGFDHHVVKPADLGALQALLASLRGEPRADRAA